MRPRCAVDNVSAQPLRAVIVRIQGCDASIVCILYRDELDRRIVAALADDARMTYPAIGDLVGLSPSAVKRRVDRLVEDATITAFTVVVDPAAGGETTEAFVEVYCRGRTSPEQIRQLALRHPEVVAASTVTGQADALFQLRCADNRELEATLERIRADDSVERTTSVIVLSRLLDRR
jgi:DNA-binding Lrp family transcriptional regulator